MCGLFHSEKVDSSYHKVKKHRLLLKYFLRLTAKKKKKKSSAGSAESPNHHHSENSSAVKIILSVTFVTATVTTSWSKFQKDERSYFCKPQDQRDILKRQPSELELPFSVY